MPTLSMFYGVIIAMYFDDHLPPHFHAKYQGHEACYALDGERIEGDMPRKADRLVKAWAELHADELAGNWELARMGEQLYKIEPLR